MLKIGITGGIGSGKTTVCEIFKLLGIPVFHADAEARILQNHDLQVKKSLKELLGEKIYSQKGELDRTSLARIIFNDPILLERVNSIIHPAVRQQFMLWSNIHTKEPYLLYEAAILLESGHSSDFDKNILVNSDEKIRIERVVKRDHTTEALVKQRIKNQMPDIQKIKLVDYTIENNNTTLLIPRVIALDKLIRQ